MTIKRLFVTILTAFIFCGFTTFAQSDTLSTSKRPKVGLVLSGGGAKGMAHIGVLKKLESVGLYPDYITGTSMGSIIGALYSIGYTIDELEDFAKNSNWLALMSNTLDTRYISINQKDDLGCYPLEFTFEGGKPVMSSGVIEGQNLSQFFSRLTWCTAGVNSFDDYPIPFRCYGVDILKGRLIEFKEGSLAQAIRGSMAIPLVFSPVLIENPSDTMLIVDGGVMHNFPVGDVIRMGADIVIGSYTGFEDEVKAADMSSTIKITSRVLMFGGVNDSKTQVDSVDYLISPDVKGVQPSDFLQADNIIKRGEDAADKIISDLKKLADSLNAIEPRKRPAPLVKHDSITISSVRIDGIDITDGENAYGIIDIADNQKVTVDMIEEAIIRLYSTLLYKSVNYRIETRPDGKIALIVTVKEKGQSQLDFGLYYDETYNIGFTVKYSRRSFWHKKYDAFVFANINQYPGIQAQISRNISRNNTLSLNSQAEYFLDFKNIYDKNKKLGDIKYRHFDWDVIGVSKAFGSHTKICASMFVEKFAEMVDHDSYSALPDTNSNHYYQAGLRLKMKHNSLDNNIYPKEGARWDIEVKGLPLSYKVVELPEDDSVCDRAGYLKIGTSFQYALTVPKLYTTFIPSASIGIGTNNMHFADQFFIGGFRDNMRYGQVSFAGMRLNQIGTHNFAMTGFTARIEPFRNVKRFELLKAVNFLVFSNAMTAYKSLSDIDIFNPTQFSLSSGAGVLVRTPIGPISLCYATDTYIDKECIYFSLGFNLPYLK
ncbi:MAG: patatin-like phospholipase family protein [Salinivirgaceae bacterium]|nr:patatin-like phospholipase family protein [Salinivirgaceae bacterium]